MSIETEVVEQFYAAINRNDMLALLAYFDPQIERVEPEGFPTSGTYRGASEVLQQVARGRGTWAEGTCEPEKIFVNGNKVVVYLYARVRLHGSVDWVEGRFADGLQFHNSKIIYYKTFWNRAEAILWAGLEPDLVV